MPVPHQQADLHHRLRHHVVQAHIADRVHHQAVRITGAARDRVVPIQGVPHQEVVPAIHVQAVRVAEAAVQVLHHAVPVVLRGHHPPTRDDK